MDNELQNIVSVLVERFGVEPKEIRDQTSLIVSPEKISEIASRCMMSMGFPG